MLAAARFFWAFEREDEKTSRRTRKSLLCKK